MAQLVKKSTYNAGDLGSIPGLGSPLEKGKATHFSILAWRIPWTIQSIGSQRVGHDRATFTYFYYYYISSTSDHQALLDPGGQGPLLSGKELQKGMDSRRQSSLGATSEAACHRGYTLGYLCEGI